MARRQSRETLLRLEALEGRDLLSATALNFFSPPGATVSDDYGNTAATATAITLSSDGAATQTGTIEKAGDTDMFTIVATTTGTMTITLSASTGSRLDSYLFVYDANQNLLAGNDDSDGTLNSSVTIDVVAGTTYYLKAAGYWRSTGAYIVQCATTAGTTTTTDDYAGTFDEATAITLSSDGAATQTGTIETTGDGDLFEIVATTTGTMTITLSASTGSRLDSYLYVYDADQNLVASNDDSNGTRNSTITIEVEAGCTYYIKAAAYGRSTGAYTLEMATVASTDSDTDSGTDSGTDTGTDTSTTESGFQIDVTLSGLTASQQLIVQEAVDRWEEIIVGDLPDVTWAGQTIDDIEISISAITIDGSGSVLGQSTATAYRSDSYLPYLGYIQLDTADVASMESDGSLLAVLEHEIAHVLGFGVIWSHLGLLTGSNTSSPGFTGANAVAEYNALFGTNVSSVPVEADGGSGTRLSHWEETVLGSELMTGWYNSGVTNAISRITIASMADLGYTVDMSAADSYTPSTSASSLYAALSGSTTRSSTSWRSRPVDQTMRLRALDEAFALYS